MMFPIPATSFASQTAITSYSPVMASAAVMPARPWRAFATSIA